MKSILLLWALVAGILEGLYVGGGYAVENPLAKSLMFLAVVVFYVSVGAVLGTALEAALSRVLKTKRLTRIAAAARSS